MSTHIKGNRLIRVAALAALMSACLLALGVAARPGGGRQGTRAYWNRRWNFCIDYPSAWVSYEPFDGSGVELTLSGDRARASVISVGALPAQPSESDPSRLETPLERMERGLEYMTESGDAQDLKVKSKAARLVLGHPGAALTFSYRDRQGVPWLARELEFSQRGVMFSVSLGEHPEDAAKFEPAFEQVTRSLKLNCRAAR
jgi:hypothetical protein